MNLICDWLHNKNPYFFKIKTLNVRNILYSGILEVFVAKEGQQSGVKKNVHYPVNTGLIFYGSV